MSSRITLAQHVYANLTADQSPTLRRGYQTLFYSRDRLTTGAVRAIESRSQHRSTQGVESKWQFFSLPEGQAVISYLTGVPEPDEFGRKGRYLAHSIIIEPSDWKLIGSTPFGLMVPVHFYRTMDQALNSGDLKTGELGAASLDIARYNSDRAIALVRQWTAEELSKLVRLTYHTQGILERGHFVSFIGNGQQILAALEVALFFAMTPRLRCAFDTSAAGCSWPRDTNFWGQGFGEQREARTPFVVLAEQKKVRLPDDWHPPYTPDEQWLKDQIDTGQIAGIPSQQEAVHSISSALIGQPETSGSFFEISEVVRTDFAKANDATLTQRIANLLPKDLEPYLVEIILSKIGRTSSARLEWLLKNPNGEGLGEILFAMMADWGEGPSNKVKQSMTSLIARHAGLRLLFGLWAGDKREIQTSLSMMGPDEYMRYVQKLSLRKYGKKQNFFCAKHLDLWFRIFHGQLLDSELHEGISFVARYGNQSDCDQLTAIPEKIDSSSARDLLQWLDKQSFRKQVKALIAALKESLQKKSESEPERSSWLGRFKRS
jgi:hypothetical protein